MISVQTNLLVACTTTHAQTAVPHRLNETSFFPSPPRVTQTCGNHLELGLETMADVEDTESASLEFLQLLHGQYGPSIVKLQKETSRQKYTSI
jgi:hypothetical protein